jgi:sugar-specific transcriptional regulator TrmB
MQEDILQKIGLTEAESRVYLSLLRTGTVTIGKIIKEAGVSNSKIYDILDRLNKKGLIGIVLINNRKHFEAKDPSRLKEMIDSKKADIREVEEILPKLSQIRKYAEPVQEAELLQGLNGFKTAIELILDSASKGDTYYILGVPREVNEVLWGYLQDWHIRRANKGVKCFMLYEKGAEKWAARRQKTPLTEVRFLPSEISSPAMMNITKDYVSIIIFGERPLCFLIKNKKVANGYLGYFSLLWNLSK